MSYLTDVDIGIILKCKICGAGLHSEVNKKGYVLLMVLVFPCGNCERIKKNET